VCHHRLTLRRCVLALVFLLSSTLPAGSTEPPPLLLTIDDARSLGSAQAKVVVVEFSDYQCSFCARHVRATMPQIEQAYIKTGLVKYVVRDFPLEKIHHDAFKAAEAAHCAGERSAFWPMHARLFTRQTDLTLEELPGHAQALGLDVAAFRQCLESGKYAVRVHRDLAEGIRAGVNSTPSFFFGVPAADQKVRVVRMVRGAQPFDAFKEIIEGLLARSAS